MSLRRKSWNDTLTSAVASSASPIAKVTAETISSNIGAVLKHRKAHFGNIILGEGL